MKTFHPTLLVGLVGALVACGDATTDAPPLDASSPADVSVDARIDAPADAAADVPLDAPADVPTDTPVDAPADNGAATDTPPSDAPPASCTGIPVLDLNTLGTTQDGVLRYTGTRSMEATLRVPNCPALNSPRVFRYTATSSVQVAFSTDNPGTMFDTTLAVLDNCPGVGTSLGCVDDNGSTLGLASIVSPSRTLSAGESVYVVVGAFDAGGGPSAFVLSVAPAVEVAVGALCGGLRRCMAGASCLPAGSPFDPEQRCFADGGASGACRSPGTPSLPRCDANLVCLPNERCIPELPMGAVCDPSGAANVCVAGTTCAGSPEMSPSPMPFRCAPAGVRFGLCRPIAPRCDTGLGCSDSNRCLPEVPAGMPCTFLGTVCVVGASCLNVGSASQCLVDGTLNGRCRDTTPACNTGLACDVRPGETRVCRMALAIGSACDTTGATGACVAGSTCQGSPGLARCVADGDRGGVCRRGGVACNTGLGCNALNVCVPEVVTGAPCDPALVASVCRAGTTCGGPREAPVCVVNGASGAPCRDTAPRCDTGLTCGNTFCLPSVAVGAACDLSQVNNVCVEGAACVDNPSTPRVGLCVLNGTRGAPCRDGELRCDQGLACSRAPGEGGTCVMAIPLGGTCVPNARDTVCANGTSCQGTVARCVADGTEGGACRVTITPCNAGLGCGVAGLCITAPALGAACDPTRAANACAAPQSCRPAAGAMAPTCQLPSYLESELTSPTFVEACTPDALRPSFTALDDAVSEMIPLGFGLRAYGSEYATMQVSTNGVLVLGHPLSVSLPISGPGVFPWSAAPRPVFAPFWSDLVLRTAGSVCVRTLGTAPARTTVVQWSDVATYVAPTARLTFEVVLREGSNQIDFVYQTLDRGAALATQVDGSQAAIGVQGAMGLDATQHRGTVSTTRGLRFTPR